MSATKKAKRLGRPRNEALAIRRRSEILTSASRLFAEHGYADTDLQWIADDLSLSKGTLYRYFKSKRDLFFATVDEEVAHLRASVAEAVGAGPNPIEMIAGAIRGYLEFFESNPDAVELLLQERASFKDRDVSSMVSYRRDMIDRWTGTIDSLKEEGLIRELPTEQLIDLLGHVLYGTIFTNYLSGTSSRLDNQANMIMDVLLNGVVTDKAKTVWGIGKI